MNEESMRNREVATKDMVPTPATQGGHVLDIPLPDGVLMMLLRRSLTVSRLAVGVPASPG